MADFDPLHIEKYRKTNIPLGPESQREFVDQQLRSIERTLNHLGSAVSQLQDEMQTIWSALATLGQPRP